LDLKVITLKSKNKISKPKIDCASIYVPKNLPVGVPKSPSFGVLKREYQKIFLVIFGL
jgi:hypothetical protein